MPSLLSHGILFWPSTALGAWLCYSALIHTYMAIILRSLSFLQNWVLSPEMYELYLTAILPTPPQTSSSEVPRKPSLWYVWSLAGKLQTQRVRGLIMVQSRDSSAEVLGWAPRSVYGLSDFWALKNRCVHVFWEKTYKDVFWFFFFPPIISRELWPPQMLKAWHRGWMFSASWKLT